MRSTDDARTLTGRPPAWHGWRRGQEVAMYAFSGPVLIEDTFLRDGLQGEERRFTLAQKRGFLAALESAGLRRIQLGSFVHPGRVPQMADTDALFAGLDPKPGVTYSALVLNMAGLDRALAVGVRHLSISISASEAHSRSNTGRSVAEARARIGPVIARARAAGIALRAGIQSALGCGFEGRVDPDRVVTIARSSPRKGSKRSTSPTPPGWPTRARCSGCATGWRKRWGRGRAVAAPARHPRAGSGQHGRGVAGRGARVRRGAGRARRMPLHPRCRGNIATEDAAFACGAMGLETGIDWRALAAPVAQAEAMLGRRLPARVSHVPPPPQQAPQCPRHAGGD
ncbi:MAG: hypothetical protein JKP98_21340 [Rhodobacteraceae bacterium]|nr:hypothetical protein [Paracoccaceae bacterium]